MAGWASGSADARWTEPRERGCMSAGQIVEYRLPGMGDVLSRGKCPPVRMIL